MKLVHLIAALLWATCAMLSAEGTLEATGASTPSGDHAQRRVIQAGPVLPPPIVEYELVSFVTAEGLVGQAQTDLLLYGTEGFGVSATWVAGERTVILMQRMRHGRPGFMFNAADIDLPECLTVGEITEIRWAIDERLAKLREKKP